VTGHLVQFIYADFGIDQSQPGRVGLGCHPCSVV
jgi:hypothetical protein